MKVATILCLTLLSLLVTLAGSGRLYEGAHAQTDIFLPDVTILEPENSGKTDNPNLRVRALVRSPLPLVGVSVSLNGEPIRKIPIEASFRQRTRYVFDEVITLRRGSNTISVAAENEKAWSKPVVREVVYEPESQAAPGLRVLVIGVSKLKSSTMDNKFATADAEAFVKVMGTQTPANGLFSTVDIRALIDEAATKAAILKELKWLNASSQSDNDVRILFLSGSVTTDYLENTVYFLTSQFEPKTDLALDNVRLDTFWEVLDTGHGKTIFFVDVDWVQGGGRYPLEKFVRFGQDENFHNYIASADGQNIITDPTWKNSAFAMALLEGLTGKADAGKQDGIIDTHELQSWIRLRVEELTNGKQLASIEVGRRRLPLFKLANR
jgi:Caspase domain